MRKPDVKQEFVAMVEPIRRLIAECKSMPRGKQRNRLEEKLGNLLKKQDALLRQLTPPRQQLLF